MSQITSITKQEAKLAAKLYIAGMFIFYDGFNTEGKSSLDVNEKVQAEINAIVAQMLKSIDIDNMPTDSYNCIIKAKEILQKGK